MAIKSDYLIEKRNILNEIRSNNMTLQELRFFSIYLAKINSRDINTRIVRFPINDFQKIMEFGRLNMNQLKATADSLLCKIVSFPKANGGFTKFQLFKECTVDTDEYGEWYVEIDSHDKALPLMFEFKKHYFAYQLWNALRLKSSNQLRMYEILKQYEKVGERILFVNELKELLGIDLKEYPRFGDFKIRVLDACQQALQEHTDIKFTYEPTGKKGKGGKILTLKFIISKNKNYIDQLSLDEFIDQQSVDEPKTAEGEAAVTIVTPDKQLAFLAEACDNEFSETEMQILYNLIVKIMPYGDNTQIDWYDYLKRKYDELKWRADRTQIVNRFGYLKKIIDEHIKLQSQDHERGHDR